MTLACFMVHVPWLMHGSRFMAQGSRSMRELGPGLGRGRAPRPRRRAWDSPALSHAPGTLKYASIKRQGIKGSRYQAICHVRSSKTPLPPPDKKLPVQQLKLSKWSQTPGHMEGCAGGCAGGSPPHFSKVLQMSSPDAIFGSFSAQPGQRPIRAAQGPARGG